jgi:hypothetical protein
MLQNPKGRTNIEGVSDQGPMREKVVGGWTRLYNKELHNLYVLLNIIRKIKLRRMRWAGDVTHMEEKRYA